MVGMSERETVKKPVRRVLIASANPLFAKGLQKMVAQHWEARGAEIRLAGSMEDAATAMDNWQPDLVIVDYDDRAIQRAAFLSHFIAEDRPMQVMLVSLRESGEVVVYDRRTLSPAQAEDWLDLPWTPSTLSKTQSLRSGGMKKHYLITGTLTAILTVLMYLLLTNIGLFPVAASVQAGPIDRMSNLLLGLISFLFSLIVVFIVYSIVVFRRRGNDTSDGVHLTGSSRLEILWTLFPLVTVIYLSFTGANELGNIRRVDPQAMKINVTAFQWGWSFEYPDQGIQSNDLVVPVDKQLQLLVTSKDVIHSFWVPEWRVKQDVLPGKNLVKELRVTPNRIGNYKVMCAELCGGSHAYMVSNVRVVSQADYDAWVAEQLKAANASPAERGQRLATGSGCTACHSTDGTQLAGPTWKGLAGHEVELTDGTKVTADDAYLHESIVNPPAKVVKGFAPIMPASYKDTLSDQQITDIIEFIKTLK
jgi:cytochrome c oxidase subunit II